MTDMRGIKAINTAANLSCYTIVITKISPERACELCERLQGSQFIVQIAYYKQDQVTSGKHNIFA